MAINQSQAVAVTVAQAPTLNEPDALHPGTVALEGTGEPGATVEILEDGVVVGTATVDENGTWTFSYSAAAGEHEVAVQNEAQPDSRSASAQISVLASLPVTGTETCLVYVVKPDEWLANLARQLWGEATRYPSIIDATNAIAAVDPSFEAIVFPDFIRPGQKLCIPGQ
jgi:hypothetical protein